MKKLTLILLFTSALLQGSAQEATCHLLFQFAGEDEYQKEKAFVNDVLSEYTFDSEEQKNAAINEALKFYAENKEAILMDLKIEETNQLFSEIMDIKAAKREAMWTNVLNGTVAGLQTLSTQQGNTQTYTAPTNSYSTQSATNTNTYTAPTTRQTTTTYQQINPAVQQEVARLRNLARNTSDPQKAQAYLLEAERIEREGKLPTSTSVSTQNESVVTGAALINGTLVAVQLKVVNNKVTAIKLSNPRPDLNELSSWYPIGNVTVQATSFQYDGEISKSYSRKFLYTLPVANGGSTTIFFN
ncbi:MAG: hypothetical protein IJ693_03745 [Bacteroidaceae bacterium]|nr:hypothetical protein [Bacteroidaceae bacterium]